TVTSFSSSRPGRRRPPCPPASPRTAKRGRRWGGHCSACGKSPRRSEGSASSRASTWRSSQVRSSRSRVRTARASRPRRASSPASSSRTRARSSSTVTAGAWPGHGRPAHPESVTSARSRRWSPPCPSPTISGCRPCGGGEDAGRGARCPSGRRWLALVLTDGRTLPMYENDFIVWLGTGSILGVPVTVAVAVLVAVGAAAGLHFTGLGRMIYAVGGNAEAAHLAGINVKAVKATAYLLCTGCAVLAGLVMAARIQSAGPTMGAGIALQAAAAVLLGGTSFLGGEGGILGT